MWMRKAFNWVVESVVAAQRYQATWLGVATVGSQFLCSLYTYMDILDKFSDLNLLNYDI